MPERAGLLWIGAQFYPTTADYIREANTMGLSRRITAVPKGLTLGEDWVFLAHPKAITRKCDECTVTEVFGGQEGCEACEGTGEIYVPGVFSIFQPTRIEKVVTEDTTEAECEALRERNIEPVIIDPVETLH
jgi:hypothetical protein